MSISVGFSLDNEMVSNKINSLSNQKFILTKIEGNMLHRIINKNAPVDAAIRDWLPCLARRGINKYPALDWSFIPSTSFMINPKRNTILEISHKLRVQYCRNATDLIETILYSDIWSNTNALYRFIKLTDMEVTRKSPILKMIDCPIQHACNQNQSSKWLSLSIFDLIFMPTVSAPIKNMILDKLFTATFSTKIFKASDNIDFQMEYLRKFKFKCNDLFLLHQCVYVWLKRSLKDEFSLTKLANFVIELIKNDMLTVKRLKRYRKPCINAFVENVIILIQVEQLSNDPLIIPIIPIKMAQKARRI